MNLDEHLAANKAKLEKHQDWKWWKDEAYKAIARAEAAEKDVARLRGRLQEITYADSWRLREIAHAALGDKP